MNSYRQEIIVLLVALSVAFCAANDEQAIRDLCRFRFGNFPHPNPALCHQFIECQLISGVIRQCGEGNIFVTNENCVPGDRTTCQRSPPAEIPIPTVTPPSIDTLCIGIDAGIFVDPLSCTSFILCLFGNPIFSTCPANRPIFDITREACFEGNPDTCEIFGPTNPPPATTVAPDTNPPPTIPPPETTDAPTIPPPTTINPETPPIATTPGTTVSPPPPPANICRGDNPYRFVADPSSCYRYFYCIPIIGIPVPGECESDRIFNQILEGCVLGNQQTCERNSFINIITRRSN